MLFGKVWNYIECADPQRPGPIGLTGGDSRRWTHEVRIPGQVPLWGGNLQAVFAAKSRVKSDPEIKQFFKWCERGSVDRITFYTAGQDDFAALQRECVEYLRRKLQ